MKARETKPRKIKSIAQTMRRSMLLLLILQATLFYATILFGGTITSLRENSQDVLNERVQGRKNYLQNDMVERYMNVSDMVGEIRTTLDEVLQESEQSTRELIASPEQCDTLLERCLPDLIMLLRRNGATGVFLALDTREENSGDGSLPCLYLRDLDPRSASSDNSDLLLERAPSAVAKKLGISMDAWWEPRLLLGERPQEELFITEPIKAAIEYPNISYHDLGYWSMPFRLHDSDNFPIITYSVPLIAPDGRPLGVLGVEISLDHLRAALPNGEIHAGHRGAYLLATNNGTDQTFQNAVVSGISYMQLLGQMNETTLEETPLRGNIYRLTQQSLDGDDVYASVQYLQPYNTNTPFSSQRWALMGILSERDLYENANRVLLLVVVALLTSMLIGMVGVALLSRVFTQPISALAQSLRNSDPEKPVQLARIHISEIDLLARSIESMSHSVANSASRLSEIIRMTGVSLGAFEYQEGASRMLCTDGFYPFLGLDYPENSSGYINTALFKTRMSEMGKFLEEVNEDGQVRVYRIRNHRGDWQWIRLRTVRDEQQGRTLGALSDITQEIEGKRQLEYERDYDLLTNLINRRAFHTAMKKRFSAPEELKIGALVMLDLDNLKYINDTYGHDCGDLYICCAARALRHFSVGGAVVSRMSGDEFLLFFSSYDSKEQLHQMIANVKTALDNATMLLPDGASVKVRASAGISWYPEDSTSYEQLIQYADFAMYKVKNTTKGEFSEFDIEDYHKDAYLLNGREELNLIIEQNLLEYYFQPIVDVKTASIFAYEALMRVKLDTMRTPMEVLALARSQSKLYQIERLTWFGAMEAYVKNIKKIKGRFLFLNSIPNQNMTAADFEEFEKTHAAYLDQIVMELTEEEKLDERSMQKKQEYVRRWNSKVALDDYGTGYSGDSTLLSVNPDFVKVDMSIVRGIDGDKNRQRILENLISYTRERNIRVIAEGVETKEEMKTLILLGVDYLQGFFLGMPKPVPKEIPKEVKQLILSAQKEKE